MAFLELRGVTFAYPGQQQPAVAGIDLNLELGEITAIAGPNGSGKTTLTKLMTGLLRPAAGEILLERRALQSYTLPGIGGRIGYVFQNPDQQLFCATVAEEIAFGPRRRGWAPSAVQERTGFYLDYFELAPYARVFPLHLSRGEKQRLAIAAVLASEPECLIMDEPSVGLDACRKRLLADCLSRVAGLGRGVVIVSHDEGFVLRVASRIVNLEKGRILGERRRKGDTWHAG